MEWKGFKYIYIYIIDIHMQIYICIYRYICMELHQQQECCSLRLGLNPTPHSSSQRAWPQLPLVTTPPGQTGLSFLRFKRPRGASVQPHLEPLGTSWEEQGHHTGWLHTLHRARLPPLVHHPPKEHLDLVPRLWSLQPNHLLCHGHSAVPGRRALQSQQPAPLGDASSLSHCSETSRCHPSKCWFFQCWVGFCVQFINKLDYFNFIQT